MYVYEAHRALGARVVTVPERRRHDGAPRALPRGHRRGDAARAALARDLPSGFVQDVAAIVRRAHEVGALVVADLYQSAGTVPVDVTAWDVDFATGGSREVAVRRAGRRLPVRRPAPADAPAAAGDGLDGARAPVRLRDRARSTTRTTRRASCTARPPCPRSSPRAPATRSWQPSASTAIRRKSVRQVQLLMDRGPGAGARAAHPATTPSAGRHGDPRRAARRGGHARAAAARDPRGPPPGGGIRYSPHFYTTDDEILHAHRRDARDPRFAAPTRRTIRAGRTGF